MALFILANDHSCKIHGIGDVVIKQVDGKKHTWKDARHVPEINKNLMSVGQLDDSGFVVAIGKGSWKISRGCMTILKGEKDGRLHVLHGITQKNGGTKDMVAMTSKREDFQVWHNRLCHLSERGMQVLQNKNLIPTFQHSFLEFWDHCVIGMQRRVNFKRNESYRKSKALELIYSDVLCPIDVKSLGEAEYFVTFFDDYSRKCWLFPLTPGTKSLMLSKSLKVEWRKRLKYILNACKVKWW